MRLPKKYKNVSDWNIHIELKQITELFCNVVEISASHLQAVLRADLQHPGRELKDHPQILHSCMCGGGGGDYRRKERLISSEHLEENH